MNKIKLALLTLAALFIPLSAQAQTGQALTSTTLSGIIAGGQNCFTVASATGITGFGPGINNPVGGTAQGSGNSTDIYVDRELMQVYTVNATSNYICALRGQGGSQASPHASGTVVWIGPPGAFFNYDPEGYCGGAIAGYTGGPSNPPQYTPWINQHTSAQWICSTVTKTWVPGFGNPGISGTLPGLTTAVVSATTIAPSGPFFTVTGATAIATITPPAGIQNGQSITILFASTDTWTAAGNIAVAGTNTTAGTTVTFTWNSSTSKWSPSRVI
jgi:hypothetical protein